jgi:calcineurin-like phosphoesterase family protein
MNIFLISDTHFGHGNILNFKDKEGNAVRPFSSVEEMDETLIENWNKVVKPSDKIYHLGDVSIPRKGLDCLARCNGDKILIRGNHDIFKLKDYMQYFRDVRGYNVIHGFIFSHIPIHSESKGRFKANIHGHLHTNKLEDKFYFNVSVEQINYTPINFEEIKSNFIEV